jgi:hypothetical protein
MSKSDSLTSAIYPFKGNNSIGWSVCSQGPVLFIFGGVSYLQGVLHSSSLPDYIEDKKSGGQKTDCLKNDCAMINLSSQDLQNLREFKQMPKSVIELIGTL